MKFSSGVEVVAIAGEDSSRVDAQQEKLGLVKMMEDKLRFLNSFPGCELCWSIFVKAMTVKRLNAGDKWTVYSGNMMLNQLVVVDL